MALWRCKSLHTGILILFLTSLSYGLSCDSGSFSGTCTVSTDQDVTGDFISGSGSLVVDSGGRLTTGSGTNTLSELDFSEKIRVEGTLRGNFKLESAKVNLTSGASINADSKGYSSPDGPGAGCSAYGSGSGGAGYGGKGGTGDDCGQGPTYGSYENPDSIGSGGGYDDAPGGNGGGKIIINSTGTVAIEGSLTADGGTNSGGDPDSGGGSGGAVNIRADRLEGEGSLTSSGGDGGENAGGGGGGGRVALRYSEGSESINIDVSGGAGASKSTANPGDSGTVYRNSSWGPVSTSICDYETQTRCEISSEKNLNQDIESTKDYIFNPGALITGTSDLSFQNLLAISGVFRGEFNLSGRKTRIKPGAELIPEDRGIKVSEN